MSDELEYDENAEPMDNIARGMFAIAAALNKVAYEIKYLGNGSASTQMGAIEAFSVVVKESTEQIVGVISEHGEHIQTLAAAVADMADDAREAKG